MASTKISALPGATTLTGAETIPVVQGGVTKKVTTDQFLIKDASGNVGVGTASPSTRLHVQSSGDVARFTNGARNAYLAIDSAGYTLFTGAGQTGSGLYAKASTNDVQIWTNGAAKATVDASGNLGLGVTPSAWSLPAIESQYGLFAGRTGAIITHNAYSDGTWKYSSTNFASRYVQQNGMHSWSTALEGTAGNPISFTQAMTLDASGNLLVGDTSASGKLHVTNTNNVSGDTAGYFALGSNTNNASSYFLQCVTSGVGGKAYILGNGDLQNANNSYGAFSDVKLKENITDASPKLAKLMQVRIVNYTLKSDPDKTKLIGVVAQELEQVSPGLIEETADFEMVKKTREVDVPAVDAVEAVLDEEGNVVTPAVEAVAATTRTEEYTERVDLGTTTKSVKYSVFVPMLIKGMQEQQAQIEALEARLAALEAK